MPPAPSDRESLRRRLPLQIVALVTVVLGVFVWIAYREVARSALQTAGARAVVVVDQIAGNLGQTTRQRLVDARRVVQTPAIVSCLRERTEPSCEAAKRTLSAVPAAAGEQVTELWTADGRQLFASANPPSAAEAMPGTGAPKTAAIGALQRRGNALYSESSVDVRDDTDGSLLGYVVSRRPLAATPATSRDLLNRLAGSGGVIKLGNRTGDVWTDLATPVPAPPVDLTKAGVSAYKATDGTTYLGALAPIPDTPWSIWVEFPQAVVLAPARAFLYRMMLIAAIFLAIAAIFVRILSARITRPLSELTELSEAIAGGDYARRTKPRRRDEVGRLGVALNAMAERIDAMHHDLESRVMERTQSLAEAVVELEHRRRELDEALAEADRYFSISRDLLAIANTDGQFVRVNPAWQEVFGWTPAEMTERPFVDFVHPEDREATAAETEALAEGHGQLRFVNRYRCKDGSYRWLSWRTVLHPEGKRLYATARDITAQRQAEVEIQRQVEELDAVNKELEAFSYSVSHDLRAPLRHVLGFAGLLEAGAGPKLEVEERRYISTIMAAATRMGRLIDDLLSFSRTSRAALTRRRVDLHALVEDVRREVQLAAGDRKVSWEIGPLPDVDGDGALLRVVLVNLLSNAVKYTSEQPESRIEIGHRIEANGEVVVFVRDNGAGFDMAYAHKLFGVFQRLHRAEEFEGTGVGLATVRRIIQRHGGRTWAEGALGQGATFSFSLPS
jgi:PAS domain S-box-containing protein